MPRLTDPIPLRSSAVWREFADVRPIPIRIGRTGGRCIPYSADRRRWVWADHASAGIDAVSIDGVEEDGWAARNTTDTTGHPVTLIEFTEPVDLGVDVTARGRGLIGPAGLVENPADVAAELCRLTGITVPALDALRAACAARSLRLAYSIVERRSLQAELRDIADSIGGIYSASIAGYVRLLPVTDAAVTTITAQQITGGTASREQLQTRITARYQIEDAQPRASLESAIPTAGQDILATIDLPCVADGRTAADVVARGLARRGVPIWRLNVEGVPLRLSTGDPVTLAGTDHAGAGLVLTADWDPATRRSSAVIEHRATTAGAVHLIRQGSVVDFERPAGGTVTTINDQRVITIVDNNDLPIVNAQVIFGDVTRITDAAGRVEFPASIMPPGQHQLLIIPPWATDGQGFGMTVFV